MNILVSACLLGVNCRYNGSGYFVDDIEHLKEKYHMIPVCPEIYGGLETPREPSEKKGDHVITKQGEDVTAAFKKGAEEVLKLAQFYDCTCAVLKEYSPSCGLGKIYDGTFSGNVVDGNGILADLLIANGIEVIGETKIKELL